MPEHDVRASGGEAQRPNKPLNLRWLRIYNTDQFKRRIPFERVGKSLGENVSCHLVCFTIFKLNLLEVPKYFAKPRNIDSVDAI